MQVQSMGETSPGQRKAGRRRFIRLGTVVKIVIVVVALLVLMGISQIPARNHETATTDAPPVNVRVLPVTVEPNLPDSFELPAVIEPNRIVNIAAEVAGRIERIPPTEGSRVQANELLVELNADLIRPQVEIAQAQYDRNKIEYERMAELVEMDATSRSDLDNATTDLARSKAQLAQVEAQLERTRIVAPISGVLNDLAVEEGEYVQPGMPVAEVVETDPVKVAVEVPERDVPFFAVGQETEVVADIKGEEETVTGTITFIDELADQRTRSTRMEITVPNQDGLLRSGQIVKVRLTRRVLKDAIMIPLLAVIPMEVGHAVYVVEDGQARRLEVQLDIIRKDRVRIKRGLEPGDMLIVAGHRFVAPGQPVQVVTEAN
jgi:membrane fusion protein (multidrug efflux system)